MNELKLSQKQEELSELFRKNELELTWSKEIPEDHQNVFWYGGTVAEIVSRKKNKDGKQALITVLAAGDVEGDLLKKDVNIDSFKDRQQEGYRRDVGYYLHNDKELENALHQNGEYSLILNDNNWIEYYFDRLTNNGTGNVESNVLGSVIGDDDDIFNELSDVDTFVEWVQELLAADPVE